MPVVAIFNQKGGVGKTTTTLNLSAALAREGLQPIAIDLDPQSHLSWSLGYQGGQGAPTVSAFFREEATLRDLVQEVQTGLRLIPASLDLAKVDALFGKSAAATTRLRAGIVASFRDEPGPILIDCCPMLGVLSLNAVLAADHVLVPVSADFLSMQSVHKLDAALRVLEKARGRPIPRKVVVTRFDARRRLSHDIFAQLRSYCGADLCETRIGETVALAESPVAGQDVFAHDPGSTGAKDYWALMEELAQGGFL
ncbi:MAG: ParA family protein [Betaproteobacteria bacterium]|nr:ParA family protein [Betaproteobacteria bacterium]